MARKPAGPEAKTFSDTIAYTDAYLGMLTKVPQCELRRARGISRDLFAETLHIKRHQVDMIEERFNVYLSILREVVQAMGGSLDIVARFPGGMVRMNDFSSATEDEMIA